MAVQSLQRGPVPDRAQLVPFKDVCSRLCIHYNTGYRYRAEGRFPLDVLEVGSRYYCRQTDVDRYFRTPAA